MNSTSPFLSGFENLGNTCYMNATFHMYSGITELVDYFVNLGPKDSLGTELKEFFTEYSTGAKENMALYGLRKAINAEEPKFNENLPQDSQEYVRYVYRMILSHFPDCPLNMTRFNFVKNGEISETSNILKLQLPEGTKKEQEITFDEILDYNMKDMKIKEAPEYIIVNMVLDINHDKHEIDLKWDIDNIPFDKYLVNGEKATYELKCAMFHTGRFTEDGHDTCYMRLQDNWFYFNDSRVTLEFGYKNARFGREYHYLLHKKN